MTTKQVQTSQSSPSFQQSPISGLVVIPPITTMTIMLSDTNSQSQIENVNMDIAARAFQLIACDAGFISAIGSAINSDLEFDVLDFLNNNTAYLQIIQGWMNTNGYYMQDVFGVGSNSKMWAYACNYGVQASGVAPTLAMSIELDQSSQGNRNDFIPCYYSIDQCNSYNVGLLGLEGDLEPEDPATYVEELTIIFEATENDFANKTVDLGTDTDNSGSVITSPNLGGQPCPEHWLYYNFENFGVHNTYSKGKKMAIAARFSTWQTCPTSPGEGAGGKEVYNQLRKLNKGDKNSIKGNYTPSKHFNDKTLWFWRMYSGNETSSRHKNGIAFVNWGIVFERDWFSLKKKYKMTCSGQEVIVQGRMRKKNELYASFHYTGDWCLRTVYRFTNRPGIGDQNSYVEIGTAASIHNYSEDYN